jgi:hypothetical protein
MKREWKKIELIFYRGSLDFPCNFCNSNSYQNFHVKNGDDVVVVCEDCLKKEKEIYGGKQDGTK